MKVDWSTQCEALVRGTRKRCPHKCCFQIPNTLASHNVMDSNFHVVHGRPVHLCYGHWQHWNARRKHLLSVALIDDGYLSAYNKFGYGSIVTECERLDFVTPVCIPIKWGVVNWEGNIPIQVRKVLKTEKNCS